MAGFGKRPWGSSPFGSLLSGITGIPEVKTRVPSVVFGSEADSGTLHPEAVLSVTEFENSIRFGGDVSRVNPQHISAYVKTFVSDLGSPLASDNILKAKSWSAASTYSVYDPFTPATPANIGAIVKAAGTTSKDIYAYLFAYGAKNTGDPVDVGATVQPYFLEDLPAVLAAIEAVNLPASMVTIPSVDLPTQADPVASVNLSAIGGGHFPEDLPAYLAAVLPVDLPVYIKGGFSDVANLLASVIQIGGFSDLGVILKTALPDIKNLEAKIGVIGQGTKIFQHRYSLTMCLTFQPPS